MDKAEDTQEKAREHIEQAEKSLDEGLDSMGNGGGTGGGVGVAAAIGASLENLSAALRFVAAAAGFLAGVLGIVASLLDFFGLSGHKRRADEIQRKQKEVQKRIDRFKAKLESSLALSGNPLLALSHEELLIDWTQCLPTLIKSQAPGVMDTFHWSLRVDDDDGESICDMQPRAETRSTIFSIANVARGKRLTVSVRAEFTHKETQFQGPWSRSTVVYELTLLAQQAEHLQLSGHYTTRPGITVGFYASVLGTYEIAVVPPDQLPSRTSRILFTRSTK